MKKIVFVLIVLSSIISVKAQMSLNDYKYVIVEGQFHFQSEPNQYQLNELTRFLFKKHGFNPVLDSETLPEDLKSNYCLALKSEITGKGMLRTKVNIVLRNCDNIILFQAEGITKEKDYSKSYNMGIRNAFEKFSEIEYNYQPNEAILSRGSASKEEVDALKTEIENLKAQSAKTEVSPSSEAAEVNPAQATAIAAATEVKAIDKVWIAKPIENGFELKSEGTDKTTYILQKTGMQDVYRIKGMDGIVYKKDGNWVREYQKDNETVLDVLNIKFQ